MKVTAISIHAAQEGCDQAEATNKTLASDFNPRSPRGLRPVGIMFSTNYKYFNPRSPRGLRLNFNKVFVFGTKFQSTQPKRAATKEVGMIFKTEKFQSTQPKRAATVVAKNEKEAIDNFNPRSPRGLRLNSTVILYIAFKISIHAAQEGCDLMLLTLYSQY